MLRLLQRAFTVQNTFAIYMILLSPLLALRPEAGTVGYITEVTNGVVTAQVVATSFFATGLFLLFRPETPLYLLLATLIYILFSIFTYASVADDPNRVLGTFILVMGYQLSLLAYCFEKWPRAGKERRHD